ncbi:MAG: DUF3667 domain-containing protein [Flavobacteriaceae bacterium]
MLGLKKKKPVKYKETPSHCLNCEGVLNPLDQFCSNCGQGVHRTKITFKEFINELLSGLFNYDSKLWRTLGIILSRPGKLPADYISGKQARYMNPFRLYLNVTILFFVIYGVYTSFNPLEINTNVNLDSPETENYFDYTKLNNELNKELRNDSIKTPEGPTINTNLVSKKVRQIDSLQRLGVKSYKKSFEILGLENTAWNRFVFKKTSDSRYLINNFSSEFDQIANKFLSQLSISLFILIPLFTLFFKLVYWRRHMLYMEHMVFIFNVQTCFTLLGIIFLLASWISGANDYIWLVFTLSFGIYLFIALKQFYQQGFIKTFIKFWILNWIMFYLISFAMIVVMFTTFLI